MKKSKRILISALAILFLSILGLLLIPGSRFHVGNNLTIRMRVKVNGETAIPYNITCLRGGDKDQPEKINIHSSDDYTDLSVSAFPYDGYCFSYDVDTPDGPRHLTFMIMKCHNMGPRYSCAYEMNLDQVEDDWQASILLVERNAEGQVQQILLSEDANAYVQLGP